MERYQVREDKLADVKWGVVDTRDGHIVRLWHSKAKADADADRWNGSPYPTAEESTVESGVDRGDMDVDVD